MPIGKKNQRNLGKWRNFKCSNINLYDCKIYLDAPYENRATLFTAYDMINIKSTFNLIDRISGTSTQYQWPTVVMNIICVWKMKTIRKYICRQLKLHLDVKYKKIFSIKRTKLVTASFLSYLMLIVRFVQLLVSVTTRISPSNRDDLRPVSSTTRSRKHK